MWRVFQRRGTIALLNVLDGKELRSKDLDEALPLIARAVLFSRLKELQELGLINRTVDPGPPIETWYSLSGSGVELAKAAKILEGFGKPS